MTDRNVLLFTAETGGGHISATKSLAKRLDLAGFNTEIHDIFAESNRLLDFMICELYENSVYYVPWIFQIEYDLGNVVPLYNDKVHARMIQLLTQKIVRLIQDQKPKLIISIHPYGTMILGILKRKGYYNVPIISIVTDYKFHKFYYNDQIDAVIVGSEYTKKSMTERGIDPEIIYPYGIPVGIEFDRFPIRDQNKERMTVLVMSGNLGQKKMINTVRALLKVDRPLNLIIICGKNKKMKHQIEVLLSQYHNDQITVELFGFIDNIYELMDRSDLIITKPGGLTVTEALKKRLPLLIPYCYPGQERENRDYLVAEGMAIRIHNIENLSDIMTFIIDHQKVLEMMHRKIEKHIRSYSMENVIKLCQKLCDKAE